MAAGRVKFVADDNLLRQVITDQAGEWKKGILELVQNAHDAIQMRQRGPDSLSYEPEILIKTVQESNGTSTLTVEDPGCGWGESEEEIVRNMQIFGNSLKKGIEGMIGEKGMGRGQAFAMIYDVARNSFVGDITIKTNGYTIYDIKLEDLSFSIKKGSSKRSGTKWTITSTFRKFSELDITEYIEENICMSIPILVNGKRCMKEATGERHEIPEATIYLKNGEGGFKVYDRGIRVSKYPVGGIGGFIITKVPLKQNFARNEVQDSDPIYQKVINHALNLVHQRIMNGPLTEDKKIAARSLVKNFPESFAEDYASLPIIKTAQGKWVSTEDIRHYGKVYYAEQGNRIADDLLVRGDAMVVADSAISLCSAFGFTCNDVTKSKDHVVEKARSRRCMEYGTGDLNTTPKDWEYLNYLAELNSSRALKLGNNSSYAAWTDGGSYICFNLATIRRMIKDNPSKVVFWMRAIPIYGHELAHDNDNRETDYHGTGFEEGNIEQVEQLLNIAADLTKKMEGQ